MPWIAYKDIVAHVVFMSHIVLKTSLRHLNHIILFAVKLINIQLVLPNLYYSLQKLDFTILASEPIITF